MKAPTANASQIVKAAYFRNPSNSNLHKIDKWICGDDGSNTAFTNKSFIVI